MGILKDTHRFKRVCDRFYTGRCTISIKDSVEDPKTHKIRPQRRDIYTDVPCRLSHESKNVSESYDRQTSQQTIMLFLNNIYDVPAGARITVTQDGVTEEYGAASVSNVWETHRQIELIKWEDYERV